jgi:hypothetical protein
MDALSEHANIDHDGEIAASPEFDWVLLQPGPDHIEIDMVKGLGTWMGYLLEGIGCTQKLRHTSPRRLATIVKGGH